MTLGSVLAACGGGEETTEVATTDGGTATVQSKTNGGGTAAELFDQSAACSLAPEQTEGPYYFDVDKIRSDVREDRDGTPLRLALRVRDAAACAPIENAVVESLALRRARHLLGLWVGFHRRRRPAADRRHDNG